MNRPPNGYLLVNKPLGWTSFDVVNKIRFMLADELQVRPKSLKVGHAGTLDPMAGGLLIVLVGSFTKRQDTFMKQDKIYDAELKLGKSSDTDDAEGKIEDVSVRKPSPKEVADTLHSFIGRIKQTPPAYSAVKVKGKPAYARARSGETPKLREKLVNISSITNVAYKYPVLKFACEVSSGTYVRSLARDIGQKLGTGAYLTALTRTKIGEYLLKDAHELSDLKEQTIIGLLES